MILSTRQIFLLLLPLVSAQVGPDFVAMHLKNHLDASVKPCDDFYRHLCPDRLNESDFLMSNTNRWFLETVKPYYPVSYEKVLKSLEEDSAEVNHDSSTEELKKLLMKRCADHRENFQRYVSLVNDGTSLDSFIGCENGTQLILTQMNDEAFQTKTAKNLTAAKTTLEEVANLAAWYNYIKDKKNNFFEKEQKASKIFHDIKESMLKLLLESAWVINHDIGHRISSIMNGLHLYSWIYSTKVEAAIDNFAKKYNTCKDEWISGKFALEYDLCFIMAVKRVISEKEYLSVKEDLVLSKVPTFNARFLDNDVFMYPALYGLLNLQDEVSVISSFGYVLAHEVGHAIFVNNKHFTESESPVDIECVKSLMEDACGTFKGDWKCASGRRTISEDAADIAAMSTTQVLRKYFVQSAESSKSIPKTITAAQMYFYGVGINWCTQQNDHKLGDPHSPAVIRVNGMLMQSRMFQEAFECRSRDAMVIKKKQRCHVFGKKAFKSWISDGTHV